MTVRDLHRERGERAISAAPQNVEAEQALLGAMLMYNGAIEQVAAIVQPEHFAEEIHRRVADVVLRLHAVSKPATPITVKTYLGDADLGGGVTVPQYLARLAANATAPLAAPDLAREVRDLAARRDLIGIAERLIDRARDAVPSASGLELASETLTDLQNIAAGSATDTSQSVSHFGDELMLEFEGSIDGSIPTRIISTGFQISTGPLEATSRAPLLSSPVGLEWVRRPSSIRQSTGARGKAQAAWNFRLKLAFPRWSRAI